MVEWDELGELPDIHQERSTEVGQITVDKRLLHVEAAGNDVPRVLQRELVRVLKRKLVLEKRLLVIFQGQFRVGTSSARLAKLTSKHNNCSICQNPVLQVAITCPVPTYLEGHQRRPAAIS